MPHCLDIQIRLAYQRQHAKLSSAWEIYLKRSSISVYLTANIEVHRQEPRRTPLSLSFLVSSHLFITALLRPSTLEHSSSLILNRANVRLMNDSPFGRPITLTSPIVPNTWNATDASSACQLQPSPDQPNGEPIDVKDFYQVIANLLRRDDIEDARKFDANKALAIWSYGTCAVVLKPSTTANGPAFDTFPIIGIARAAATVSTNCVSTPASFHGGAYTVPLGPRGIFHIDIIYNPSRQKSIPGSTVLAASPTNGTRPSPNPTPPGPPISCDDHDPETLPLTESDCNFLIAGILSRNDVMTQKTFYDPDTATDMAPNSKHTLQPPGRFRTPWLLRSATCNILTYEATEEADAFRLLEVARYAAVILSDCRRFGPPFKGGSRLIGPKRAFEVKVYGNSAPPRLLP